MPILSIIVAADLDGAIGHNGDLLCHLSADLKRFKALTMGHAIIMGRKTFDSLPKGALPGRKNIVITRNADFAAEGAVVVHSLDEALAASASDSERFILGGAQLYDQTFSIADRIYLTRIEARFPQADTRLHNLNIDEWEEIEKTSHPASERDAYPYSFITLERKR